MPRRAALCLALLSLAAAAPAGAANPPQPNGDPHQLASWLTGLFHPSFYHRTLTGRRVEKLDGNGETMVLMELQDEDLKASDFWLYGVSRGPSGAVVVRQYWMAGKPRKMVPITAAETTGGGRAALIHLDGCDLVMRSHQGAYEGKVNAGTCKGEVEDRLFRVDRELAVDYQAVTPTVKLSAAWKRKHPDDTGTEMYFRSTN
jgi:hypothetical protein